MKRNPEHVCQFFLAELGTDGSISENSLILKGKHISKNIEILIIKYIGIIFSSYYYHYYLLPLLFIIIIIIIIYRYYIINNLFFYYLPKLC
jgi:hypothetical protein